MPEKMVVQEQWVQVGYSELAQQVAGFAEPWP